MVLYTVHTHHDMIRRGFVLNGGLIMRVGPNFPLLLGPILAPISIEILGPIPLFAFILWYWYCTNKARWMQDIWNAPQSHVSSFVPGSNSWHIMDSIGVHARHITGLSRFSDSAYSYGWCLQLWSVLTYSYGQCLQLWSALTVTLTLLSNPNIESFESFLLYSEILLFLPLK